MKVLVFGQYNPLILSIISKLKKEAHQIFTITGKNRKSDNKCNDVFQEYNFKYNDSSISYILTSINPDVVIVAGAIDSNYTWQNEKDDSTTYLGDVAKIINQCAMLELNQFLYVSTMSIFDGYEHDEISKSTIPKPVSYKTKAIYMGEKICENYSDQVNFPVNILRIGQVYGAYDDEYITGDICSAMCTQAINEDIVEIVVDKKHDLIYLDDAAFAFIQVLKDKSTDSKIYHVFSPIGKQYSETELFDIINSTIIIDPDKMLEQNITNTNMQENQRTYIKDEDDIKLTEKYDIVQGMKVLYDTISNSRDKDVASKKRRFNIKRYIKSLDEKSKNKIGALVGNILFFLLIQTFIILTRQFVFHDTIDIYLLYIMVIAVIYGYRQGVLAIALSVVGKINIVMMWTSEYIVIDRYGFYLWILQIFAVGIMIGYLKDKYKRKFDDLDDDKEYLTEEVKKIKAINASNLEVKNLYENRIVDYKDSFARVHSVISKLDVIEPERVIFKSVNVVEDLMRTKGVSVYLYNRNSPFYRLMATSTPKALSLGKSIKVAEHNEMFSKLLNKELYINKDMNSKYPMLAGGSYLDDQLETVIMVWSLPYGSNNLYSINVFGVICKLIESTMNKANDYVESINDAYDREFDNVLDSKSFNQALNMYEIAKEEGLADYSLLDVLPSEGMSSKVFFDITCRQLRDTDYIRMNDNNSSATLLLTNTSNNELDFVASRLNKLNIKTYVGVA